MNDHLESEDDIWVVAEYSCSNKGNSVKKGF